MTAYSTFGRLSTYCRREIDPERCITFGGQTAPKQTIACAAGRNKMVIWRCRLCCLFASERELCTICGARALARAMDSFRVCACTYVCHTFLRIGRGARAHAVQHIVQRARFRFQTHAHADVRLNPVCPRSARVGDRAAQKWSMRVRTTTTVCARARFLPANVCSRTTAKTRQRALFRSIALCT